MGFYVLGASIKLVLVYPPPNSIHKRSTILSSYREGKDEGRTSKYGRNKVTIAIGVGS